MKKERVFLTGVFFLALSLFLGLSNGLNAQPLPDLVVTKIECVPPQSKFAFEVMNKSNVPLPKGWKAVADVYFGKVKKGFIDLGSPTKGDITLPGGTAYYLTAFNIVTVETIGVVADAKNSIKESNETNNTLTVKIAPCLKLPKPDLVVDKIWAELSQSAHGPGGQKIHLICFTVKNIGSATFNGTLTINASVSPGPYYGIVYIDSGGAALIGNPLVISGFNLSPGVVSKKFIIEGPDAKGWLGGGTYDCTVWFSTDKPAEIATNNKKSQKLTLPE